MIARVKAQIRTHTPVLNALSTALDVVSLLTCNPLSAV